MYLHSSSNIHIHNSHLLIPYTSMGHISLIFLEMFGVNRIWNLVGILVTSFSDVCYNYTEKKVKGDCRTTFAIYWTKITNASLNFTNPQFLLSLTSVLIFKIVLFIILHVWLYKIESLNSLMSSIIFFYTYLYYYRLVVLFE